MLFPAEESVVFSFSVHWRIKGEGDVKCDAPLLRSTVENCSQSAVVHLPPRPTARVNEIRVDHNSPSGALCLCAAVQQLWPLKARSEDLTAERNSPLQRKHRIKKVRASTLTAVTPSHVSIRKADCVASRQFSADIKY